MVAPTFKKATDTNPGSSVKYGAPDIKYMMDVLDGSHATDRIQASVIEGAITYPDIKRYGGYFGGVANLSSSLQGFCVNSALAAPIGTPTYAYVNDTTGKRVNITATGVTNNTGGHSLGEDAAAGVRRDQGFRFKCKFNKGASTSLRIWIGLKSATGALTGDTALDAISCYLFHYNTAVSTTQWYIYRNNGSATPLNEAIGTADNNPHTIELKGDTTGCHWSFDGGAFTTSSITQTPGSTTSLFPVIMFQIASTSSRTLTLYYWFLETNI